MERKPRDRYAIALILAFLVLAISVGLRTGYETMDVDQQAFRRTLEEMQHGTGYYPALREALVEKEGAGPSNVRAYRLPTLYLALSLVPQDAQRLVVAVPFAVLLLAAWRLGRPYGDWGGTVSVWFVGFWVEAASPFLYLHAEIWGAALLMAGLVAARRRTGPAAALLAAAVSVRELFAPAFAFGLIRNRRSKAWWLALAALGVLAVVHARAAAPYLDPRGYQPPLRFSGAYLEAIGPGDRWLGAVVGIVGGVAGTLGCVIAFRRDDAAARIALGHNLLLAALTVTSGRTYWGYCFGPSTAVFAAVTLDWWQRRQAPDVVTPSAVGADAPFAPTAVGAAPDGVDALSAARP